MSGTMLVAVDGSPEAYNALIWVLEHIKEGGRACAVYVISPTKYAAIEGAAGYEGISTLHEIRERIVNDEREQVTNRVKELAHDRSVDIEILVRTGDPRSEILNTAEEIGADLIAVGSTGKGLGARILLGSVSTYIISHAKVSTIVVR
ncbi:MAG: universal stress protein [Methanomicrobiales archaeon]|nr:universal stress protein [Methanomicrobiales archaeon]